MGQVSKLYHSPFLRYPTTFSQNTFLLRKWLLFIPRAPEIPTSKFSGLLNTMGQVSKPYHSPFLRYPTTFSQNIFLLRKWFRSFPELQKSLLVSFQGCWTQWDRFQSSTIHHFWDTPHFLELQKSLLISFQGCWTQWDRFQSFSIHHFWDTPQHFLKTHFCWESGFLSFLELQKSLLVSFQGCWTQWQTKPYHSLFLPQIFSKHIFASGFHSFTISEIAFTISEIPHSIFSKHIFAEKVAFFHS